MTYDSKQIFVIQFYCIIALQFKIKTEVESYSKLSLEFFTSLELSIYNETPQP